MRNRLFLALVLTGLVLLAAAPTASSAPQTPSGFSIFASPKILAGGALGSVAAVSASDVWAVGKTGYGPLVEHYNGSSWSIVRTPLPSRGQLYAVSARGSAVWAVGDCDNNNSLTNRVCVIRYTGSAWVRVPVPAKFTDADYRSVLVFSNTNVLVGGGFGGHGKIIRWNGTTWSQVKGLGAQAAMVVGIAGTLSTHLFASLQGTFGTGVFAHELTNGTWQAQEDFGAAGESEGISASSSENVWVVGDTYDYPADVSVPLAMRWNGTTATPISVPSYSTDHELIGVVTTAPNDTWAVGWRYGGDDGQYTLIEHYTGGSSFTDLGGPNLASPRGENALLGITAVPGSADDLWAVGQGGGQPLIVHHAP